MSDEREQAIEASGDTAIALAERLRRIGIDGLKRARIDRSIDEDWCRDEIAAADYITRSESVLQAELDAARDAVRWLMEDSTNDELASLDNDDVPVVLREAMGREIQRRYDLGMPRPAPKRCEGTLGTRAYWMGVDQYDPCQCRLDNGHEGPHWCEHLDEPDPRLASGDDVQARPPEVTT